MPAVKRILDLASGTCLLLASVSLVVLVAIFGWLVFGRYVLNSTPTWVEQLALLLVVVITFLGSATGIHEETHLGISFIREAMPPLLRDVLRLVCNVTLCLFGAVMFVQCVELVRFGWDSKLPMLNIPEGVRTLPAAACGALIVVFAGYRAFGDLGRLIHREPDPSSSAEL